MKYRDHRGSLSESMKTVREINSIEELKKHLNSIHNRFGKSIAEIRFEYVGMDDRIEWDTYYVVLRFEGYDEFTVAGMSDNIIPDETNIPKSK